MRCVLGIDAAWSERNPSGVAIATEGDGRWGVVASAASAEELLARVGVSSPARREWLPVDALLDACLAVAGELPRVVAVDMPVSRGPLRGRRLADDEVNRRYGRAGIATHSPTPDRPGPRADELRDRLARRGVRLRTARGRAPARALLEVYPHVALLALTGAERRLTYKVSRSGRYWLDTEPAERVRRLLRVWRGVRRALARELDPLPLRVPRVAPTLASLKAVEDELDAVVCAWVGIRYLAGGAEPLGDAEAAVWVPAP